MKYECDIIRDLMTMSADGLASEKSERAVWEHIAECPACAEEWEFIKKDIDISIAEPESDAEKQHISLAKRIRRHKLVSSAIIFSAAVWTAWWMFVNPYNEGVRFTAEQAAVAEASFTDSIGDNSYNVLGEYSIPENNSRIVCITDVKNRFYAVSVKRGLGGHGLWKPESCMSYQYRNNDDSTGVYFCDDCGDDTLKRMLVFCYSDDTSVDSITLTNASETYTQQLNEKGFALFEYPEMTKEDFSGEAKDNSGKTVYTLCRDEGRGYFWKKAYN